MVKSPKLYFYDTGLASNLLRIQHPESLDQHPYRGALFENWVITEFWKQKLNQGQRPNLYFWRDRSGHEIDLIEDQGVKLLPVEIRSGQTINQEYFKGLRFWERLTGIPGGRVIYGGNQNQKRSDGTEVISWKDLY